MGTESGGGRRIGRYEVELPLAEGPLSRAFVARDPVLGRRVVVKALRDDLDPSAGPRAALAARVREKARAFAGVSHPMLVALHDMGELAGRDDAPFLVFELVRGSTLAERLASGAMPPADVATLARALGAALTQLHGAGFVHGDVRPENVMLAAAGPKLTEPGFARIARGDAAEPSEDQLALAATLYEAFTGKRPVLGGLGGAAPPPGPSTLAPHLRSFPHLDTIFDRAFAASPRRRFTSCEVLGNVVAHEIEGADAATIARASASSIVPRATRRRQNLMAAAAVLVIVVLVLLGRNRQPRPAPTFSSGSGAPAASTAPAGSPRDAAP